MNREMRKKIFVLLMSLTMIVTMMPLSVFADNPNTSGKGNSLHTVTFKTEPNNVGDVLDSNGNPVDDVDVEEGEFYDDLGILWFNDGFTYYQAKSNYPDEWVFTGWEPSYGYVDDDMTITAHFAKNCKISLQVQPPDSGKIVDDYGGEPQTLNIPSGVNYGIKDSKFVFTHSSGTEWVNIAQPAEGYEFIGWGPIDEGTVQGDMTLTAYFSNQTTKHKVSFDSSPAEGGKIIDSKTGEEAAAKDYDNGTIFKVDEDGTLGIGGDTYEPTPSQGAEFAGWNPDWIKYGGYITSDMNFEAKFKAPAFTVTFDVQGYGTAPEPQKVDGGGTATKPIDPVEKDCEFQGWYTNPECQGEQFDFNTQITKDITLYAKWKVAQYTVSFDMNEHGSKPDDQLVYRNKKVTKPDPDPSEDGWWFDGWYKDKEGQTAFDFDNDVITGDTTLYAKWEQTYGIYFEMHGHGDAPEPEFLPHDAKIIKPEPDPSEEGWRFDGWFYDEWYTQPVYFGEAIAGYGHTLHAKWLELFDVKFDMNGHGTTPETQQVAQGELATDPGEPECEGYTFLGWYTLDDKGEKVPFDFKTTAIQQDTTIYADWQINRYNVYFDVQGHGTAPYTARVDYGQTVDRPKDDPWEKGWRFDDWYEDKECTKIFDFDRTPITHETTIYAKWTELFTVSFDTNGHGEAPDSQEIGNGEPALEPSEPEAEGYTFIGWYDNKECKGEEFNFDTPITADTVLYAKWAIDTYTVSFDVQGHGIAPDVQTVNYGDKAQKPADPSEEGWTFDGWYDNKECIGTEFDFDTPIKANTILYAKWTINTYTVTFDANGHGTAPEAQTVNYNDKAQKPVEPSEEGYTFGGWYKEKECENEFDFTTPIKADTTLYAKWTINTYTVTFDVQGHGAAPDAQSVDYNDKAQKPDDPSEEGYTFGGWYDNKECIGTEFDFDTPIKANTILYAKWTINTYTVSLLIDETSKGTGGYYKDGIKIDSIEVPYNTAITTDRIDDKTIQINFDNLAIVTAKADVGSLVDDFVTPESPIKSDCSFSIKFRKEMHTVVFDPDNGRKPVSFKIIYGETVSKPNPDPTKEGYKFGGWYDNNATTLEPFDFTTPITTDLTLMAHWDKKYAITKTQSDHARIEIKDSAVEGETVSVKAIPLAQYISQNDTYKVTRIVVTANGEEYQEIDADEGEFTMPGTSVEIRAEVDHYNLTSEVTPDVSGSVDIISTHVSPGDTASFTVNCNDGYKLQDIKILNKLTGEDLSLELTSKKGVYAFEMPAVDAVIKVVMEEVPPGPVPPGPTPEPTPSPVPPINPVNPEDAGGTQKAISTGDDQMAVMFAGLGMASIAGATVTMRRRNKKK